MLENHLGAATISGPTSHQVFVEVDHSNVRNDNPPPIMSMVVVLPKPLGPRILKNSCL